MAGCVISSSPAMILYSSAPSASRDVEQSAHLFACHVCVRIVLAPSFPPSSRSPPTRRASCNLPRRLTALRHRRKRVAAVASTSLQVRSSSHHPRRVTRRSPTQMPRQRMRARTASPRAPDRLRRRVNLARPRARVVPHSHEFGRRRLSLPSIAAIRHDDRRAIVHRARSTFASRARDVRSRARHSRATRGIPKTSTQRAHRASHRDARRRPSSTPLDDRTAARRVPLDVRRLANARTRESDARGRPGRWMR